MFTKKLFSLLTSVVLLFAISVPALAVDVPSSTVKDSPMSVQYVNINSASSTLSISGGTASIVSYVTRTTSGESIYLMATLQQYSGGIWTSLISWTVSTTSTAAYLSQSYTVSKGTYRVATYYSVSGTGGTESNTIYSKTATY